MNTKKIVSFFVTAVIAASSLFALAACDNTPKRELEGIEVTTAPTKIESLQRREQGGARRNRLYIFALGQSQTHRQKGNDHI